RPPCGGVGGAGGWPGGVARARPVGGERGRGWWRITASVLWAALAPAAAGHWPTGAGIARSADWLGIPVAAFAFRTLAPRQRAMVGGGCGAILLLSCAGGALPPFGLWPEAGAVSRV